MKKVYMKPHTEAVLLKANQTLLAGSITRDAVNDTYYVGGLGDRQEGDEDI